MSFLQETHTTPGDESAWLLEWQGGVYMSHLSSNSSGVAILLAPTFQPEIVGVHDVVPGRLLHLAVRLDGVAMHFINVYAPRRGVMQTRLFRQLSTLLSSIDPGDCVILGGDFNCTLEVEDRSGLQRDPASAKTLKELVGSFDLVDSWRNLHPDSSAFSRRSREGGSRIDRLYISRAYISRVSASSMRPVSCSDHHLVWMEFTPLHPRVGSGYWHFNNQLLEDSRFRDAFRAFWVTWRERRREFCSLRLWWDVGKAHIRFLCREYTRGSTKRRGSEIERLERALLDLESGSWSDRWRPTPMAGIPGEEGRTEESAASAVPRCVREVTDPNAARLGPWLTLLLLVGEVAGSSKAARGVTGC